MLVLTNTKPVLDFYINSLIKIVHIGKDKIVITPKTHQIYTFINTINDYLMTAEYD